MIGPEAAAKIFLAYLEGDREAAKITEGWARKERDRRASPSVGVHGDPPPPDDPYALVGPRRGLRCALGVHDDGTDAFGGVSVTCLRCGRPL
jgi:hypothetical protein